MTCFKVAKHRNLTLKGKENSRRSPYKNKITELAAVQMYVHRYFVPNNSQNGM